MDSYSSQPGPAGQSSTTAIISLIAGIGGVTVIPVIGSIVAVITGHMAKKEIAASMGRLTGEGLATVGLVLGYLNLALAVLGLCLAILALILGISLPLACLPFLGNGFSNSIVY